MTAPDKNVMKRLHKEIQEFQKNPPPQCTAAPVGGDLFMWEATIDGPPDTPYSGGLFKLSIKFPQNYPMRPPEVKFITRIYHPNIAIDGRICLDTVGRQWSPVMNLSSVLISVQQLLIEPNPGDALHTEAGRQMRDTPEEFKKLAKQWTEMYARRPAATNPPNGAIRGPTGNPNQ